MKESTHTKTRRHEEEKTSCRKSLLREQLPSLDRKKRSKEWQK